MENELASGKTAENYLQPTFIKPFENIALAFSGGGFRAASYAQGVLAYLNAVKFTAASDTLPGKSLLQQVTYLSSASGGSIAAALYSLYDAKGKTFEQFYVKLFETLTGDRVLEHALLILADKKRWAKRPGKSRNIINAFAMAYDEYIFEGHTLQSLLHSPLVSAHLQEVCLNTTEFYTGMSYRQNVKMMPDNSADPFYKFGNENIYLAHTTAVKIKLGDALAASSCFPAGFEPIIFPADFAHQYLNENELKQAITLKPQTGDKEEQEFRTQKCIGFMDGGITDNQGLQSLMYADGRRMRDETTFRQFDLMLVNDVDSYFIKPYVMPPQPKNEGISLAGVNLVMIAWLVMSVILAGLGIWCKIPLLSLAGGILLVIPLIFMLMMGWLKGKITGASSSSAAIRKSFTERIIKLLLHYFTKTPLAVLKQMLLARAESVLMLNTGVFMKRVRQLIYNKFYDSPQWKNRGKGNHIYDLTLSNDTGRKNHNPPPAFLEPGRDMQIVAQTAFNMGTTLWFDKQNTNQQHSLACLIACGQFTTCYNLLQYIQRLLDDPGRYDVVYETRLQDLKQQMLKHYEQFKADPFFMYNNDGSRYEIQDFKPVSIKDIPFPENWA